MKRTGHIPLDYEHSVVEDDDSPFFAVGRELESSTTTHHYTAQEKKQLNRHQAIDYFPPNSEAYRKSLTSRPTQNTVARWRMMALIGFAVGSMAYVVKNTVEVLLEVRAEVMEHMLEEGHLVSAWAWVAGYSTGLATLAAALVVVLRPAAAGSGIPEVIAYLNGTHLPQIFNLKTLAVKFVSLILALGAGLPLGPEGPMIHMGGMIGAGLSQGRSRTLKFSLYRGFRDSRDKRDFISAGVAAGVSAAFGAPVGGTLFAFEEVASFWNQALGWQIFFCSMVSVVTLNFWQSGFHGFAYHSKIGEFETSAAVIFVVTQQLPANIIAFAPTIVVGILCGALGALFTFFNLKIVRFRRRRVNGSKVLRVLEVSLIMLLYATAIVVIPMGFGCRTVDCSTQDAANSATCGLEKAEESAHSGGGLLPFTCHGGHGTHSESGNSTIVYNEAASLFLVNSEEAVIRLFSRRTPYQFGYGSLLTLLAVYLPMSCWATGSVASSGIEPLLLGTIVGRLCGLAMVDIFGDFSSGYWSWIDPGAFALVGAAAFFAGVSRLTMSLTVIMIEITNDINFLLPIMTAVMVAKWVADSCTHSLYHALIEVKCLPFLDGDVSASLHLDAVNVGHAMQSPVRCVPEVVSVHELARLLLETEHNGYPVVRPFAKPAPQSAHRVGVAGGRFAHLETEGGHPADSPAAAEAANKGVTPSADDAKLPGDDNDVSAGAFVGILSRDAALALLRRPELFLAAASADMPWLERRPERRPVDREMRFVAPPREGPATTLRHPDLVSPFTRRSDPATIAALRDSLLAVLDNSDYADRVLDLRTVIDESAFVVPFCFSLERTYIVFRSMGLRHLVVTDESNGVAGIVTRYDLMGFHMEERIAAATAHVTWNRNPAQSGIEMAATGAARL